MLTVDELCRRINKAKNTIFYHIHRNETFRKTKSLHRLLLNPSNDKVIDHINRNPLDNRRMNLKICTQLENMQNRGLNKNSTTKIVGVYKDKNGKYIAHCQINKTRKTLGKFNTKNNAIKVLEKYRKDNKIG